MSMAGAGPPLPYYVADISYAKRHRLYQFLDVDDRWRRLAAALGHTMDRIDHFGLAFQRPDRSPSKEIIDNWTCRNPTFAELITVLQRLEFVRAKDMLLDDTGPQHTYSQGSQERPPRFVAPPQPPHRIQNDTNLTSKLSDIAINKLDNDMFPPKEFMSFEPFKQHMNIQGKEGREPEESPDASGHTMDFSDPKLSLLMSFPSKPPVPSPQEDRGSPALLNGIQYHYAEIQAGSNNFAEDSILGTGGFGVVYRAVLTRSNVAVKVLKKTNEPTKDWKRFERHVKDIINYRHENIIDFRGYSIDGPERCLVYNYMENGSLEDRLLRVGGTPPLSWRQRHVIMVGASRGLQYLHTVKEKPLVHGDIKSANILLDEHFKAKIADFDEAREATGCSDTGRYTHIQASSLMQGHVYGTRAYLPDDFVYNGCQFSIWTDIFSFGVVLFEVCTGLKAFDAQRNKDDRYLKDVMESLQRKGDQETIEKLKDRWAGDWPSEQYNSMVNLAYTCTKKRKKDRPVMPTVLSKLEQMEVENRIFPDGQPAPEKSYNFQYTEEEATKPNFQPATGPVSLRAPSPEQGSCMAAAPKWSHPNFPSCPVDSVEKLGPAMKHLVIPENSGVTSANKDGSLLATDPSRDRSLLATDPSRDRSLLATDPSRDRSLLATDPSRDRSLLVTDPSRDSSLLVTDPSRGKNLLATDPSRDRSLLATDLSRDRSLLATDPSRDGSLPAADAGSSVFDPSKMALPEDEGVSTDHEDVSQDPSSASPLVVDYPSDEVSLRSFEQDATMRRIEQKETTLWPFISEYSDYLNTCKEEDVDNDGDDTLEFESDPNTLVLMDKTYQGSQDIVTIPQVRVSDCESPRVELSSQHQGAAQQAQGSPPPSAETQGGLYNTTTGHTAGQSLDGSGSVDSVLSSGPTGRCVSSVGEVSDKERLQKALELTQRGKLHKERLLSAEKN